MLFVVLTFFPEIIVLATSVVAKLKGCQPSSNVTCEIGPSSAGEIIRSALEAGSFVGLRFSDGLAAIWLTLGCFLIWKGWQRLSSRLLLGLAVSLVCAFVPYFGPMLSIGSLVNPNCNPNEGGIGPCMIYGGNIGFVAHDTVRLAWRIADGAPIALGIFGIFAIVAIGAQIVARRATSPTAE
ncbi:hypothetical protein [Bradyrhizobium sp. Ce-3]|uniref:hypothetical protein n=1 Tax=Bradyrhizobium sp. Ce-3 TaxID=2913970 RepID=UPI001FC87ACC|nr:hypothetical protein [Bradyrhizobium sp. Ce-3]GKQ51559.1 hypothetical protein BRSPCE3_24140 [Bradyrhizobium sp. Ce-3]